MKTKFKFLATMLIGILLSTNVWGETTYTLVTAVGDLTDGDKVVIATKGTGSAIGTSGVTGGELDTNSKTKHDAAVNSSGWMVFTIEDATQTGWKLKNDDNQYVGNPTDNTFFLTTNSQSIGTCFVNSDGVFGCNENRFLQKNSSNIRMYALNNSYTKYYLFKSSDSPAFTLTVQSNNESYGTVSRNGMTINCTPADGYYVQSASSTSSAITPSVDGNTVTLTGTLTENTTVTVTFASKPQVDVYLSEAGALTKVLGTFYLNDSYTLPSTTTGVCDGKTFVGWSTVDIPMPGDKPTENYYDKGAEVTLAVTNTFYAVYADAAGGADPVAYTAGDEGSFVLAALNDGKWYALPTNPTVDGGKITGVEISVSQTAGLVNYVTTENAAGYTWTIANATNGQTISDGTKYIYHSNGGSSGTNLAYGNETKFTWSIASETNGLTFKGVNEGTVNSRGMLVSGTTFGGYALSNEDATGYYRISVLPISGATYSNYTTCGSKYSVTFKNQESVISTTEYTAGTVIHAPATAENTCGDGFFFVGWLAQPLYVGDTPNPKPDGLIQPNGEITVPAENVVYYAVFAQKRIN